MAKKLRFNSSTIHGGQEEEKDMVQLCLQYIRPQHMLKKVLENTKVMSTVEHIILHSALERSISA